MKAIWINCGFLVAMAVVLPLANAAGAATYRDALGRAVTLKGTPMRIVTLAPNLTEILYFLGLGDRVVGVTRFSDYPPAAVNKPKVGSYAHLNIEKILTLKPDLAIGTVDGNEAGAVGMLEQAGIPVYVVNPRNVREAIATIATLGRLCGAGKGAEAAIDGLRNRMQQVVAKTSFLRRPLVFLQINVKPIMSVNRNTIHNDVIRLAGGINLSEDEPVTYPRISLEEIIQRRPEVIIISSMERGGRFEEAKKAWMKWRSIPAVKAGRVHLVPSDLLDRPSPRLIRGLEIMARLIHPEVEWKQ